MKKLSTLLLVLCSFSLAACGGASPGDRVEEFAYAMEDGDAEKVKDVVPGLATFGSEKFEKMVEESSANMKEEGGIKSVVINSEEIDGDTAKVTATITMGNGNEEKDDFVLEKIDGKWVITLDMGEKDPQNSDLETPDTSDLPGIAE